MNEIIAQPDHHLLAIALIPTVIIIGAFILFFYNSVKWIMERTIEGVSAKFITSAIDAIKVHLDKVIEKIKEHLGDVDNKINELESELKRLDKELHRTRTELGKMNSLIKTINNKK